MNTLEECKTENIINILEVYLSRKNYLDIKITKDDSITDIGKEYDQRCRYQNTNIFHQMNKYRLINVAFNVNNYLFVFNIKNYFLSHIYNLFVKY